MLSHGYWQRRFGGDPAVVGRVLTVEGRPRTVIGVMPGDAKRIRQILFNLVSNARRYTERGDTIEIGAERLESMVRFWVADTGRGIEFDQQATAFDNFRAGENGGAGLGLALVRSFAELHNGWVSLQSEPGAGTTVSVYLPTAMTLSIAAE